MNSPTNSSSADDAREAVSAVVGASREALTLAQMWRRRKVSEIQMHALSVGLDASIDMVDKHFPWFLRWHAEAISTGHLMRQTGVRKRQKREIGGE